MPERRRRSLRDARTTTRSANVMRRLCREQRRIMITVRAQFGG